MTPLVYFVRFFVGVLFTFSGFIKANDPLGFGYKLQEYFEVFSIQWLSPMATGIAIFICGLEIILGLCLLAGIMKKIILKGLLYIVIFFAFLTFYSAYFEVVTSCGCFGDAIPLTPWESFFKDIILLVLVVFLLFQQRHIRPFSTHKQFVPLTLAFSIIVGFGIGIYTYRNLPFIDFLPYEVGNSLPKLMEIPPNADIDEYEIIFELQNADTKEILKVSQEDYINKKIYEDTILKFVSRESRLIKKGFTPEIGDFNIFDDEGENITQKIINDSAKVLLIVIYDIKNSNQSSLQQIKELTDQLVREQEVKVFGLTSSSAEEIQHLTSKLAINFPILTSDSIPLKSMVRSNPGMILLKNGIVLNKWHYNNMPTYGEINAIY